MDLLTYSIIKARIFVLRLEGRHVEADMEQAALDREVEADEKKKKEDQDKDTK